MKQGLGDITLIAYIYIYIYKMGAQEQISSSCEDEEEGAESLSEHEETPEAL